MLAVTDGQIPPERFTDLPRAVQDFLATLTPAQIAALSSIQPGDVSAMRSAYYQKYKENEVADDSLQKLQSSFMRWLAGVTTSLLILGVGVAASTYFNVKELRTWQAQHMEFHRDRQTENATAFSSIHQRLAAADSQLRQLDQHNYRLTQAEDALRATNSRIDTSINQINVTLSNMAKEISTLAADIRVLRTTLDRQEARQTKGPNNTTDR